MSNRLLALPLYLKITRTLLLFSPTGERLNLSHFSTDFLKGHALHAVSVGVIFKIGYQPFHHRARDPKRRESGLEVCLIHHLLKYHKAHTIRFPKESMKLSLACTREAFPHESGRGVMGVGLGGVGALLFPTSHSGLCETCQFHSGQRAMGPTEVLKL